MHTYYIDKSHELNFKKDMSKAAVFSVIHPGAKDYLDDFYLSLENQSEKSFDVVIINDGLPPIQSSQLNLVELPSYGSIAHNRQKAIEYLKPLYDVVIFADSDDTFSINRVEDALNKLQTHDFVVNDLNIVGQNLEVMIPSYLSDKLQNHSSIELQHLMESNFCGLSNTAVRLEAFPALDIPNNLVAVDWYIFTQLLFSGKKGVFSADSITNYRQHDNNTVGFKEITEESLFRELDVKLKHYNALKELDPRFQNLLVKYENLSELYTSNPGVYLEKLKQQELGTHFWWETSTYMES
jgi:glycosyltransferase involved in cell wall biosynthesis